MKNNFFIKLIETGLGFNDSFSYNQFLEKITNNEEWQIKIIDTYFDNAVNNWNANTYRETIFLVAEETSAAVQPERYKSKRFKYTINLEATFKFIDYIELINARENAQESKRLSWLAIILAFITIVISIIFSIFGRINLNNSQMQRIESLKIDTILIEEKLDKINDSQNIIKDILSKILINADK